MTHFLCKYYHVEDHNKLVPARYAHALVRPCNWSYSKVLGFLNGKVKGPMELGGQVAMYTTDKSFAYATDQPMFKTLDEWMVWLNYSKGIIPEFEEIYYSKDFKDYIAKTIDLKTGTVLWDKTKELKQKLCGK